MMSEIKQHWKSTGIVYGAYWGGGEGSYPARKYSSDISKEDLIEQNQKTLDDGSLDSGMGYQDLIGALIVIETISTTIIEGKISSNSRFEDIFIGKLTERQQDFLSELLYDE